ncbi:MAG: hypothetical protein HRU20_23490 [Pseudomonadales bacterium]|nr:hypothetical protein [Pseudomonadales bacterium]
MDGTLLPFATALSNSGELLIDVMVEVVLEEDVPAYRELQLKRQKLLIK